MDHKETLRYFLCEASKNARFHTGTVGLGVVVVVEAGVVEAVDDEVGGTGDNVEHADSALSTLVLVENNHACNAGRKVCAC